MGVLAGTLLAAVLGYAESPPTARAGSIVGLVSDLAGVPQVGATVLLYSRYDKVLKRTFTNDAGTFGFDAILPDVYAVRVSLSSFLPALKRNIVVQPGMQSLLSVNLAHVFSSIELVGLAPGQTALMSDEWKWVLRSAAATRPVLRLLPDLETNRLPPVRRARASSMFSETRGLVKVSAGDQGSVSALGNEPDLGTAFAVATSFLGKNELHFSGNFGYSSFSGTPTAGLRTSFRREMPGGTGPEVKLTMRQMYLPERVGAALFGGFAQSAPVLRTLSATYLDQAQLTERVRFEYGFSLEGVTFLDRLAYFSPYGRVTYDLGPDEAFLVSYASGTPPAELFAAEGENGLELQQDLASLAVFPRVSLRDSKARVQRTETWEAGYRRTVGTRTFSAAVYKDDIGNAAVTLVGAAAMHAGGELVPDLFSESWIFNAGDYNSLGFIASITQSLGPQTDATVAYGSGGALTTDAEELDTGSPEELRAAMRHGRRHSLTARVSGSVPQTGSQFVASYQWASLRSLTPAHMYLTQRIREGLGLNLLIRQPIPYFSGLPGRLEATAELRNLLAQGYIPLISGGRRLYLMQSPRSVRGGLSFVF